MSPETFNKWRIAPRILISLYGWICYDTHQWITGLPDPTTQQMAYATLIFGAAAAWFGLYTSTGGK